MEVYKWCIFKVARPDEPGRQGPGRPQGADGQQEGVRQYQGIHILYCRVPLLFFKQFYETIYFLNNYIKFFAGEKYFYYNC